MADRLRESFRFYDWDEAAREVRWMCSFDTSEEDIDAFVAAIRRELAAHNEAGRPGSDDRPTASLHGLPAAVA